MIEDVTGIMVCYNTERLARRTIDSVRRFYPDIPLVIVNNSDRNDPCTAYINSLAGPNIQIINTDENIGHGPGMHLGIKNARTKYALIFDSDIVLKADCVGLMMEGMQQDTFGVGKIVYVGLNGNNKGQRTTRHKMGKYYYLTNVPARDKARQIPYRSYAKMGGNFIPYLHPYFHLLNIENYKQFRPYVDHGAPCISTMRDIWKKGLSDKALVNFQDIDKCVRHDGRGTRSTVDMYRISRRWRHLQ